MLIKFHKTNMHTQWLTYPTPTEHIHHIDDNLDNTDAQLLDGLSEIVKIEKARY